MTMLPMDLAMQSLILFLYATANLLKEVLIRNAGAITKINIIIIIIISFCYSYCYCCYLMHNYHYFSYDYYYGDYVDTLRYNYYYNF